MGEADRTATATADSHLSRISPITAQCCLFDRTHCTLKGKPLPLPVGSEELKLVASLPKSFIYRGLLEASASVKISYA